MTNETASRCERAAPENPGSPLGRVECPVCGDLADVESKYLSRLSTEPEQIEAAAEAVADALGFCGPHGYLLALHPEKSTEIAMALAHAIPRVLDLLRFNQQDDSQQHVFFDAPRSCPICKFQERTAASPINHLASLLSPGAVPEPDRPSLPLCVPHFRALASALKPPALEFLARLQLEFMLRMAAFPGLPGEGTEEAAASVDDARHATVQATLRVVAGRATPTECWIHARGELYGGAARTCGTLAEALQYTEACPLCIEEYRADEKWIHVLEAVARVGQDIWIAFPTCPRHIWMCSLLGNQRVASTAACYAVEVMCKLLKRATAVFAEEDRHRETAAKSVWYRPRNPAYEAGQRRKLVTKLPRCPACERVAVARDRATGELLGLLRGDRHRAVFQRGHGLCLKHFAHAYLLSPAGKLRSALVAMHAERLSSLRSELESAPRGEALTAMSDESIEKTLPWQRAVRRFSGYA